MPVTLDPPAPDIVESWPWALERLEPLLAEAFDR
jgi:hypothetical protein